MTAGAGFSDYCDWLSGTLKRMDNATVAISDVVKNWVRLDWVVAVLGFNTSRDDKNVRLKVIDDEYLTVSSTIAEVADNIDVAQHTGKNISTAARRRLAQQAKKKRELVKQANAVEAAAREKKAEDATKKKRELGVRRKAVLLQRKKTKATRTSASHPRTVKATKGGVTSINGCDITDDSEDGGDAGDERNGDGGPSLDDGDENKSSEDQLSSGCIGAFARFTLNHCNELPRDHDPRERDDDTSTGSGEIIVQLNCAVL
jgi:hypothetical protein